MTCAVGSDRKQEHLQQDLVDQPLSLEQLHFPQSPTLVVLLLFPVCMWEDSPWEASSCLAQKLLPMLMAHLC